jgi:hypothetical protein
MVAVLPSGSEAIAGIIPVIEIISESATMICVENRFITASHQLVKNAWRRDPRVLLTFLLFVVSES